MTKVIEDTSFRSRSALKVFFGAIFLTLGLVISFQLLTASSAHAEDVPPTISLTQNNGAPVSISNATPSGGGGGGAGGGGGGGGTAVNPLDYRSYYRPCQSSSATTGCITTAGNIQETRIYKAGCATQAWGLFQNGTRVSAGGAAAIRWLLARADPLWNNLNAPEEMANDLSTARDWNPPFYPLGTTPFQMPRYADIPFTGHRTVSFGPYAYKIYCVTPTPVIDYQTTIDSQKFCAPGGAGAYKAPIGVVVYQKNMNRTQVLGATNKDWRETSFACLYASPSTQPQPQVVDTRACFFNVTYNLYSDRSRSNIRAGGTKIDGPYKAPAPTAAFLTNNNRSLNNCSQTFTNGWGARLGEYGYYRIQGDHQGTSFTQYRYPAWTNNPDRWFVQGATSSYVKNEYAVYSCNPNGGRPYENVGTNFGSLPAQGARVFDSAGCPQVTWRCDIDGTVDIAQTNQPATVMRDGTNVPLRLPGVTISGNGVRDATGSGAVRGNSIEYFLDVVAGSSPTSPATSDINSPKQYYKMWKADGTTNEKFKAWLPDANGNRNKFLSYIWSSENGLNWSMNWQTRFSGQFLVPRQDTITGAIVSRWIPNLNVSCGPASNRTSNLVNVIRSVGG